MKRPSPRRRMIRELCRVFLLADSADCFESEAYARLWTDSRSGACCFGRVALSASHYMRRYVAGRRMR